MAKINWRNFNICLLISMGQLCFAYPSSIIGSTLAQPAFLSSMSLVGSDGTITSHGNTLIGAFNGVFQAGSVFGVIVAGWVMEKFGRKSGMRFCAVVSIISGAVLTASQNPAMFTVFRFFAGLGSWGFLVVTPVYCSELAQPAFRGLMVGMNGVMIGVGYSIATYMGLAFNYSTNETAQWRGPLGLALFFPVLMLIILAFMPESPRYLLMTERSEQAWKIVQSIHSTKGDPQSEFARAEFYQMQKQIDVDRTLNATWFEMVKRKSYRKRLIVGMGFAFFSQSTGAFVINNYGSTIYRTLGYGARQQLILECGWISVSIFGNLGGALFLDRFGRKSLMLYAFIGCVFCLVIEAAMVALYAESGTNKAGLGVAIAATYLFSVFYTPGVDCNCPVFFGELFPNHIRAKGATACFTTYALTDLIYLEVAGTAFETIGWKFYLVFIIVVSVGTVWVWFFVPETKGVPLEEMAAVFGDSEDIVVFLRDVHLDGNTNQLVLDHHGKEGDVTEQISEKVGDVQMEYQPTATAKPAHDV